MPRQDGKTTAQMEAAPVGAVFIWCNHHLYYPQTLARRLNRPDLVIKSPSSLDDMRNYQGTRYPAIILDHACNLTERQWESWREIRQYQNVHTSKEQK